MPPAPAHTHTLALALACAAVGAPARVEAGLRCQTFADYNTVCEDIAAECCDEVTESCRSGVPAKCNAGCAAVLVPAYEACIAEGGWLAQPTMASAKVPFQEATALCTATGRGPPPPLPCVTAADFNGVCRDVTSECCDEAVESCSGGIPSSCNAGCAAVLLPAQAACAAKGGYLSSPTMATVRETIERAAALCHQSCAPPATSACDSYAEFAALRERVSEACAKQQQHQQQCDAECEPVVLSVLAICTTGIGFLAGAEMEVERRALTDIAARCATSDAPVLPAARTLPSSCDSHEEYRVLSEEVRRSCCSAGAGQSGCVDGVPTACVAGPCLSAVLALNGTCSASGGFLLDPAMAATRAAYTNASSGCCVSGASNRTVFANCTVMWECTEDSALPPPPPPVQSAAACASMPCQNGGTCADSTTHMSLAPGAYSCTCNLHWYGLNCETTEDDCTIDRNPCQFRLGGARAWTCVDCARSLPSPTGFGQGPPNPECPQGFTCEAASPGGGGH